MRTHIKRKCCEPRAQLFDLQRQVSGLHVKLQKSPGPPLQGHELAGMASAGQKFVLKTCDVLSFNLIAIAFFAAIVNEGFRVSQADCGAFSATDSERGIGSSQL